MFLFGNDSLIIFQTVCQNISVTSFSLLLQNYLVSKLFCAIILSAVAVAVAQDMRTYCSSLDGAVYFVCVAR